MRHNTLTYTRYNMLFILTVMFLLQVGCEWIEISQQHYKKPLRPIHSHPLLNTLEKPSEARPPTHNQATSVTVGKSSEPLSPTAPAPPAAPVVKVSDVERVTKRNRIYINHTLPDNNWDTGFEQTVPANVNGMKIEGSLMNINEKHDYNKKKPQLSDKIVLHEDKNNGDILIIRKPKPEDFDNRPKLDKPSGHQSSVAGNVMRVRPTNNKGSINKPKPLDEYQGAIEVLNMSDLEYTTAEDTLQIKLDNDIIENSLKHKQINENSKPPKVVDRRKTESSKAKNSTNEIKARPYHESKTKPPIILKGVTNMRRVEILRSTIQTPIEDYSDYGTNKASSPPRPEEISENRNRNRETGTTPYKFPNIGLVKRVRIPKNTTRKPVPDAKYPTTEFEIEYDNYTETSEEVENNIRRIDKPLRRSTTEKTMSMRTKPGRPALKNRHQTDRMPSPEDVMLEELITEDEKQIDFKVHKIVSIGTIKRVPNPTKAPEINIKKLDTHDSNKQLSKLTSAAESDEDDVTVEDEDHDLVSSTEKLSILTTPKFKTKTNFATGRPEINPQIEKYQPNPYKPARPNEQQPEFVTKEHNSDYDTGFELTSESYQRTSKNKIKTEPVNRDNTKRKENQPKQNASKHSKPQEQVNENTDDSDENDDPLSNNKNNAMENLIKFLKTVTEIIARNTRRGVHGKLRYLEDLRDTIMANIEERLEAAFPDDSPTPGAPGPRRARSAELLGHAVEPRGHVEFPSSEGALMTISFLTFAVFLIKLVLQVIQAYKNKTMMMMPTVVAAVGRAYIERQSNN